MSVESFNNPAAGAANNQAGEPAPEQEITAAPGSAENEVQGDEEPKTFTQEELDAKIGERLAKERRKWEREQQQAKVETPRPAVSEPPKPDDFRTVEEYIDALADHKAEQKAAEREAKQKMSELDATFAEREEAAREKYNDFDRVAYSNDHTVTREMAEVIKASEIGPDIAYWLGKNPDESNRIAGLTPLQQAREIGKVEVTLNSNPPAKKASSAPEPIKPVGSRSTTPAYDTTDPRSTKTLSPSEWIAAENARRAKLLRP